MARHPSSDGRLAAALGPPPGPTPGPADGRDPPTVPLAVPVAVPPFRVRADTAAEPAPPELPGWGGRFARSLVPPGWRGARVDPGRPGATALALVAALAAVVAAVGVWVERPRVQPVGALPAVVVTSEAQAEPAAPPGHVSDAAEAPAGPLVVSVAGRVGRPGLVEVPDGSRVADVLDAAGGALPDTDLSGLNLARRVVDGEQIAVAVPPAPDAAPPPGAAGRVPADGGAPSGPVDLNTATAEQLDALPGVGPVTATRILEWREGNGRFSRIEQLREIEGIGERRFAQLRELVVV